MIRKLSAGIACISVIFFPWPLTAVLTLGVALFEPLVPLAVGLLMDTLYYLPHSGAMLPLFTIYGAFTTIIAFFVRDRLKASIIGE